MDRGRMYLKAFGALPRSQMQTLRTQLTRRMLRMRDMLVSCAKMPMLLSVRAARHGCVDHVPLTMSVLVITGDGCRLHPRAVAASPPSYWSVPPIRVISPPPPP